MKTSGIVLGVGAPNQCADGRKTMCAIILSDDCGLIRVYPIPAESHFPVWGRVSLEIERSATDNRKESYKITSFYVEGRVDSSETKRDILDSCVLRSGKLDPINYQNERRASIALVKLPWGNVEPALSQRVPDFGENNSECQWIVTQGKHWNKPYLQWISEQGASHKTHLVGREVYEGLRKNPDQPWNIFNNMQINSPDYEIWLLLGNMRDRRNVWVAPHVHRLKKNAFHSTPLFSTIRDGKPEEWPYCEQADSNVRVANDQLELFTIDFTAMSSSRGSTATAI
jgi:hypothetical protein